MIFQEWAIADIIFQVTGAVIFSECVAKVKNENGPWKYIFGPLPVNEMSHYD